MTILSQGQNASIGGFPAEITVRWENPLPDGLDVDTCAYLLTAAGKVRGDGDMVFYGQRRSADGGTELASSLRTGATFTVASLPNGVERAAITAVVDDTAGRGRGFGGAGVLEVTVKGPGGSHSYRVNAAATGLTAVILAEVYMRNGEAKVRAVGQGFAGGLKPLAEHFGVAVENGPTVAAAPAPPPPVSLEKRLVSLEKVRPQMVSLVKKADAAVARHGLSKLKAKLCIALDISGSMSGLYASGKVDALVERVLALGFRLDDDGMIDVFAFGKYAHECGQIGPEGIAGFSSKLLRSRPLEPDTMYGLALERIRGRYRADPDYGKVPLFVMFVTDGGTRDKRRTETHMMESSREAIFWKFMAIGPTPIGKGGRRGKRLPHGFDFLAYLDDMQGRLIDNADFFAVEDPTTPTDDELYGLMLEEFPSWLANARKAGVLRD